MKYETVEYWMQISPCCSTRSKIANPFILVSSFVSYFFPLHDAYTYVDVDEIHNSVGNPLSKRQ